MNHKCVHRSHLTPSLTPIVPQQSEAIVIYTGWERHALVGSDIRLSCSFFSWRWTSDDVTFSWSYRADGARDSIFVYNHLFFINPSSITPLSSFIFLYHSVLISFSLYSSPHLTLTRALVKSSTLNREQGAIQDADFHSVLISSSFPSSHLVLALSFQSLSPNLTVSIVLCLSPRCDLPSMAPNLPLLSPVSLSLSYSHYLSPSLLRFHLPLASL